jgi:hypothetical protein
MGFYSLPTASFGDWIDSTHSRGVFATWAKSYLVALIRVRESDLVRLLRNDMKSFSDASSIEAAALVDAVLTLVAYGNVLDEDSIALIRRAVEKLVVSTDRNYFVGNALLLALMTTHAGDESMSRSLRDACRSLLCERCIRFHAMRNVLRSTKLGLA